MATEISTKLQELPHLPKPELLALWQELFAKPPHPRLRRNLIIPILAYRLQEQAYGGLKPSTRKRLKKLAAELDQKGKAPLALMPQLKSGTKLLRQWQGEMHEILVADEGFEYRGKRYDSLSEIARQITGTRWSGPGWSSMPKATAARQRMRSRRADATGITLRKPIVGQFLQSFKEFPQRQKSASFNVQQTLDQIMQQRKAQTD